MKTINYKRYKLGLAIGNYVDNDRLYLGLIMKNGEDWGDLSVNIPSFTIFDDNEFVIDGDNPEDLIEAIEKAGIIKLTDRTAYSGYGAYKVAIFNEEVAKDYIVADYRGE